MAATEPGQVIEQFTKCFNSGDIEGLASLYEDGAAFIPQPGTVVSDATGLRAALQGFLDTKER
jgi:ketosteroid isomerase-like protein